MCAGLAVGVLVALAATRFLEGSLYNVSSTDPATFLGVAVVLLVVALVAQSVPIARAMRVDPTVALRQAKRDKAQPAKEFLKLALEPAVFRNHGLPAVDGGLAVVMPFAVRNFSISA